MIATPLDICIDCIMLLANGETDPELSESETAEYVERVNSSWDGWDITLGALDCEYCEPDDECESTGFHMSACDLCGSTGPRQGGGDRYHATAWPITPEASGYDYRRLVFMLGAAQRETAAAELEAERLQEELDDMTDELADTRQRLRQYEPPTPADLAAYMWTGKTELFEGGAQ